MVKTTPQFRKLIHILAPHVEREQLEKDQMADGMLVRARLLEPGQQKVYYEPSIKKVSSSSSGRSNIRQTRMEDGDYLDLSMASYPINHPGGVAQSVVALDMTGEGSSRSPTQCTSFPAIGSVFGDTAGMDTRSLLDGDDSDGLAQPRLHQDFGVQGPASIHQLKTMPPAAAHTQPGWTRTLGLTGKLTWLTRCRRAALERGRQSRLPFRRQPHEELIPVRLES